MKVKDSLLSKENEHLLSRQPTWQPLVARVSTSQHVSRVKADKGQSSEQETTPTLKAAHVGASGRGHFYKHM